jgi:hypothetical protein
MGRKLGGSILFIAAAVLMTPLAAIAGDDNSGNTMAKGALVGAGTNVIGGAVLDSLDGSNQPQYQQVQVQGPDGQLYWQQVPVQPDPTKTVLKRAVQGAITGAVAAEFAKDDGDDKKSDGDGGGIGDALSSLAGGDQDEDDHDGGKSKHKKSKEGHRPPGWDRGKKTGWGDGDVPPGHQD